LAIVQISQITNRKGLQIDLPQLAGAELGWSVDERRLFIGNGTLAEGAPVVGNTEILTEFSDIIAFQTNYTYQGDAAGYVVQTGPTPSTPVTQSLQTWLDQIATVKDFGAVGDGVTDDTAAINRALYQLYCREVNPQIRRSLFFPAGVYRVTQSINIPTYATLYGEGIDNSIISMDTNVSSPSTQYVARTADSLQQTSANIGSNGATPPQFITITNLGFQNLSTSTSVFLVESATNCRFQNVGFAGTLTTTDLTTDSNSTIGVDFQSTSTLVCKQIVLDGCRFGGTTWAVNTGQELNGITISNSKFDILYQGILLGTDGITASGPSGFRIVSNMFDNIYAEGIIFGTVQLNASAYNIFYDVANHFGGITTPFAPVINIESNNNVSLGDMFERPNVFATQYFRVAVNQTTSIAMTNSDQIAIGQYVRQSGQRVYLLNDVTSPTAIFTVNAINTKAFVVDYTIERGDGAAYRTGSLTVSTNGLTNNLTYTDDFTQNEDSGIVLSVTQSTNTVSVNYISTDLGPGGSITYSINYLR
jgi:hypothetical protein